MAESIIPSGSGNNLLRVLLLLSILPLLLFPSIQIQAEAAAADQEESTPTATEEAASFRPVVVTSSNSTFGYLIKKCSPPGSSSSSSSNNKGCSSEIIAYAQPDVEELDVDDIMSMVNPRRSLISVNSVTKGTSNQNAAGCGRNINGRYVSCTTDKSGKKNPQGCGPFNRNNPC